MRLLTCVISAKIVFMKVRKNIKHRWEDLTSYENLTHSIRSTFAGNAIILP